jgi:hypothetical protein
VPYADHYRDRGNWPDPRRAYQRPEQPPQPVPGPQPAQRSGGAGGNERLTDDRAVLLLLLAVEGLPVLRIGRLLTLHVFLGLLFLGQVALKAGSVIYHFARYYTGSEPVPAQGAARAAAVLARADGHLLTAVVFGSGVMLAVTGPGQARGCCCTGLVHLVVLRDDHPRARLRTAPARAARRPVIALLTVHLAGQWRPVGIPFRIHR